MTKVPGAARSWRTGFFVPPRRLSPPSPMRFKCPVAAGLDSCGTTLSGVGYRLLFCRVLGSESKKKVVGGRVKELIQIIDLGTWANRDYRLCPGRRRGLPLVGVPGRGRPHSRPGVSAVAQSQQCAGCNFNGLDQMYKCPDKVVRFKSRVHARPTMPWPGRRPYRPSHPEWHQPESARRGCHAP